MDNTYQIIRDGYSIRHCSRFPSRHPCRKLLSCDFSSDGKIVASGGETAKKHGAKPFICNVESLDSVTTSESHSSTIFDVRFQPGSTIFATSSADKTVKLWDAKKRVLCNVVGHTGTVRSLDFLPLGGILCSSDTCDVIKVWDLNQRVMMKNFMAGSLVRFQPGSGKLLAVANQNVITILEYPSLVFTNSLQGHVKNICSLCWDVTRQTIASVSEDCVSVWSLSMDGKRFQSVIFHPRHRNVLVVSGFQVNSFLSFHYDHGVSSISPFK
ncbi:putative transcription factor WD40-like family [Medicago truncatula]|uniref:Putative transcription factor WD40-like family n=1 Tax=Medicago truncatula TaxID=3880 RepID=A0A396I9W9_MEDTR|nr:putative transcription factor WD40-like family [Medicago truncatula]